MNLPVPGPNDDVLFDGTEQQGGHSIVDQQFEIRSLTIENTTLMNRLELDAGLTIKAGGKFDSNGTEICSENLTLDGGTFTQARGNFGISRGPTNVTVNQHAKLELQGSSPGANRFGDTVNYGGGIINFASPKDVIIVSGSTFDNYGTINWSGSGKLFAKADCRIINEPGAEWNWTGTGDLGMEETAEFVNDSTINLPANRKIYTESIGNVPGVESKFSNYGILNKASAGTFTIQIGRFVTWGAINVSVGELKFTSGSPWQAGGTTVIEGSSTLTTAQLYVVDGGVLSTRGNGTIQGSLQLLSGGITPGEDLTGTLTVTGDYSQSGGVLAIDVDVNAGTHDVLAVGGFVSLIPAAVLFTQVLNNPPSGGETYNIMPYGMLFGDFGTKYLSYPFGAFITETAPSPYRLAAPGGGGGGGGGGLAPQSTGPEDSPTPWEVLTLQELQPLIDLVLTPSPVAVADGRGDGPSHADDLLLEHLANALVTGTPVDRQAARRIDLAPELLPDPFRVPLGWDDDLP